jgi:hypothetical protein
VTGAGPFPSFDAYLLTITVAVVLSSGTLIAGLLIRTPKPSALGTQAVTA